MLDITEQKHQIDRYHAWVKKVNDVCEAKSQNKTDKHSPEELRALEIFYKLTAKIGPKLDEAIEDLKDALDEL